MRPARATALAALAALAAVQCGGDSSSPAPRAEGAALGGEVAARVSAGGSSVTIPLALIERVAAAEKVDAHQAAARVIDDEVAASAARARGLDRGLPTSWLLRSARARIVADRIREEARAHGPPTDQEVEAVSKLHWVEVDRPPAVSVVHALVSTKEPSLKPAAERLAGQIRAAVVGTPMGDLDRIAHRVWEAQGANPNLALRVEALPPFIEDGRVTEGSGAMDPTFAKAAYALANPGDTSAVVDTRFGAHVIRLVERLPAQQMPFEERRRRFTEEVIFRRAHEALEARVRALRAEHPLGISTAAESLMRSAMLGPAPESESERP